MMTGGGAYFDVSVIGNGNVSLMMKGVRRDFVFLYDGVCACVC